MVKLGDIEMHKALVDAFKQIDNDRKELKLGIPISECHFNIVKVPKELDRKLIAEIISLELRKYVSIPVSELSITYSLCNSIKSDKYDYYLTLSVRLNYLHFLDNIFRKELGYEYEVEPSIFGTIKLIEQNEVGVSVLINMDNVYTTLVFILNGNIIGVERLIKGVHELVVSVKNSMLLTFSEARQEIINFDYVNEEDDIIKDVVRLSTVRLLNEILTIRNNYELSYNVKCNHIYLAGEGACIKNIDTFVKDITKMNVTVLNGFQNLRIPELLSGIVKTNGPKFASTAGLLIDKK